MKKICSIFLLCIVCLVANAQKVQWGDFFKMEDHNKTRCDYLGTIDDLDYYSFGYYVTGGNLGKFNHIGFFSMRDTTNFMECKDYISIPRNSLVFTSTTSNDLAIVYTEKNKEDKSKTDAVLVLVDKNSFKEKTHRSLLSFDKKDSQSHYSSKDGSKHLFVIYHWDKKQKSIESMTLMVFDKNFNQLYQQEVMNKTNTEMWIRDVNVANNGSAYMLCTYYENKKNKKDKTESILLNYVDKDSKYQRIIECEKEIENAVVSPLKDEKVLIAFTDGKEFNSITYSIEESNIVASSSFKMKTSNNKKGKGNEETQWIVTEMLELDNGNVACIVNDIFSVWVEPAKTPGYLVKFDRNFYVICLNPMKNELVYTQLVSRSTKYQNLFNTNRTDYEKPIFFTYNNNVYSIYNTSKKDNDLSEDVYKEAYVTFYGMNTGNIAGNLLKISPEGNAEVKNIIVNKEAKAIISTTMTHEKGNGVIVIGSRGKKDLSMGILNLK